MRHFKILGVALVAVFAVGIATASSAFALPDVSLTLAGSAFPLHLEITDLTVATNLSNAAGAKLKGEGFLLLLLASSLSSLGAFEALFTKVTNTENVQCSSTGDPAGEVLTKGTYHVVYTSLSPLTLGVLYLVLEVSITCAEEKVKVRGNVLSNLNAGTEATELTEVGGVLKGNTKGVPNLTTWYNQSGVAQVARLEGNFGTGSVQSAEEVAAEEEKVKALGTNMFVITGR